MGRSLWPANSLLVMQPRAVKYASPASRFTLFVESYHPEDKLSPVGFDSCASWVSAVRYLGASPKSIFGSDQLIALCVQRGRPLCHPTNYELPAPTAP
jgi:hypothetical protein